MSTPVPPLEYSPLVYASREENAWLKQAFIAGFIRAHGTDKSGLLEWPALNAYDQWLETLREAAPLEDLNLGVHMYNALRRQGVRTVGQAREWLLPESRCDFAPAYDIRNMGFKRVTEAQECLREFDDKLERRHS